MDSKKKNDTAALKQRIQQLEKALEKANVLIYGLNSMIDYAGRSSKFQCEKSVVSNREDNKRKADHQDGDRATLQNVW